MDLYASSQFFVQVDQTFLILSGLYIYLLAHQLGDILQGILPFPLHHHLMSDIGLAAINHTVFQGIRHRQIIGDQVSFAIQKLTDQFFRVFHDLQFQLDAQ